MQGRAVVVLRGTAPVPGDNPMKAWLATTTLALGLLAFSAPPVGAEGGGGDGGTPAVTPPPSPPPDPPRRPLVLDNLVGSFDSKPSPEEVVMELFDRPMFDGIVQDPVERHVRWRLPGGQTGTMRFLNDGTLIFSANGVDYRGTWRFRGRALAVTVPVLDGGKERAARVEKTERIYREDGRLRSVVSFTWGGFNLLPETLP